MTVPTPWNKKRAAPRPTEHAEQVAFVAYVRAAHPIYAKFLAAVPNGGMRAMKTAKRLKAEGVSPGYPDLLLDYSVGNYHGLRIEMKRARGSRGGAAGSDTTDEQDAWIARLRHQGYAVAVCHGADEAIETFEQYIHREEIYS